MAAEQGVGYVSPRVVLLVGGIVQSTVVILAEPIQVTLFR